jgi:hypothetical protein
MHNVIREKKCPSCGANLMRMPTKEVLKETLISFAEDKGYIFWSIVYLFSITIISFFEQIFGTGGIFDYIIDYKLRFIFYAFFTGSIIDYVIKANVEVTAVRNKYIFKPPIYLRRFRRWTDIFFILGLATPVVIMILWPGIIFVSIEKEYLTVFEKNFYFVDYAHPKEYGIHVLTAYTFIPAFWVGLIWSIMGLVLTEKDMSDKRIKYFMDEMRMERVKRYHRASVIYIGGIFVAGIVYYKLINVSGLFFYIWNSRMVYSFVKFFKEYFGWAADFYH